MLFGHQTDDTTMGQIPDNGMNEPAASTPAAPAPAQDDSLTLPTLSDDSTATDNSPSVTSTAPSAPVITPAADSKPFVSAPQELPDADLDEPALPAPKQSDDLLALKQQALSELTPLVTHLDQSPEEKFRTTMMLLQSTDNQALLKEAYAAAQAIPDDKARAQALLDVINEINYFTQQK